MPTLRFQPSPSADPSAMSGRQKTARKGQQLVLKLSGPGGVGRRRVDITNEVSVFNPIGSDDGGATTARSKDDDDNFMGLYHPTNHGEAARFLSEARGGSILSHHADSSPPVVEENKPERQSRRARQQAAHVESRIKHQHNIQMGGFIGSQRAFVAKYAARLAEEEDLLRGLPAGGNEMHQANTNDPSEGETHEKDIPCLLVSPQERAFSERRQRIEARHAALELRKLELRTAQQR